MRINQRKFPPLNQIKDTYKSMHTKRDPWNPKIVFKIAERKA